MGSEFTVAINEGVISMTWILDLLNYQLFLLRVFAGWKEGNVKPGKISRKLFIIIIPKFGGCKIKMDYVTSRATSCVRILYL